MRKKIIEETVKIKAPIKHARFIVRGGDYNPIGYSCEGLQLKRRPGEAECELRARCVGSVDWSTPDMLHVFIPIKSTDIAKPRGY